MAGPWGARWQPPDTRYEPSAAAAPPGRRTEKAATAGERLSSPKFARLLLECGDYRPVQSTRHDRRCDAYSYAASLVAPPWYEVVTLTLMTTQQQLMQVGLNSGAIHSIRITRGKADSCRVTAQGVRRQRAQTAPGLHRVMDNELGVALKSAEALEVLSRQAAPGGQCPGILSGQAKGDAALRVRQHCRAHRGVELMQELVRQREARTQAPRLGQRVRQIHRQVQVRLELVKHH